MAMEMMSAVRPLETFVPPRAAGQRDVLSLALPPMPLLHVAFVGVGLAPDAGGLFLLTRSLGATRATQLAMTGEAFTAEKAMEAGALYRLCTSEQLEKTREQLLKKLRRGSSNSYAAIKKLVWESEFKQWHEYAQLELELQKSLSYTEDFKEGVRAHSERRRPKFIGK